MNFFDDIERYGNNTALVDGDKKLTYTQLVSHADQVCKETAPRSLVFVVCTNHMEAAVGYIGMLRKRAVPVMVNASIEKSLFDSLRSTYLPSYIWCPKEFLDGEAVSEFGGYHLVATGEKSPEMDKELALLLTTSGSTGSPKLVRQTYRNLECNTEAIVEYLEIVESDRAITTLPMSYTYGLSIIQSHLHAGARIVFTEKTFLQREFWNLFRESGATTFGGVPYTYEMLDKLRFLRMDLPTLRYVTQAGGKLSPELHFKFAQGLREQGKKFIVMYGATEATARMAYVPSEQAVEKAGSIGIAIPGGRFELIDADNSLITETDKVGELVYYGDNVTMGYAECRDDLNKGDERGGRLETGDMAKMDSDGYYFVVGRKKRFLKLFGNRINLMELEALLGKAGFECACVGEDDNLRAYTTSEDTKAVLRFMEQTTHINHTAFSVIHIDKIPRNDSGKVLYSELK